MWLLHIESCTAVREHDGLRICVRDQSLSFIAACLQMLKNSRFDALVFNKNSVFTYILAKFMLARRILDIEGSVKIRFHEIPWGMSRWRGEAEYIVEMLNRLGYESLKTGFHPLRAVISWMRKIIFAAAQLSRSLKSLRGIKKKLGYWELSIGAPEDSQHVVEVWWVAPRHTTFAWIQDFLKIAKQHSVKTVRVANCHFQSAQIPGQMGFIWHPIHVSWLQLWITWLKGMCLQLCDVNKMISKNRGTEVGDFHYVLRDYWRACLLDTAEDMMWESIFGKTISRNKPVLMFFTHFYNIGVAAFLRVSRSWDNVKSVYIQHGINNCIYYPPLCDCYWTLMPQDRDTLVSSGIEGSRIAVLKKIDQKGFDQVMVPGSNINSNKTIFFINQYSVDEVFTPEYIVQYLDRIASLAERHGWQFIVRPHPAELRLRGIEKLKVKYPQMKISDDGKTLLEQLQTVKPAVVATFFSTGIIEAVALNTLPVLLQVGLEVFIRHADFDYNSFGVVIQDDAALERELARIMSDDDYRLEQYKRVQKSYEQATVGSVELETLYSNQLDQLIGK